MKLQAHKGVSTEFPENTMPAFVAAVRQGYRVIELDVGVTKDLRFVLLHDDTLNRTARKSDGSMLEDKIAISDITYEQVLEYDFGVWYAEEFRGTKITLLDEVLELAKKTGIGIKIDNKYQRFSEKEKKAFFDLLKPYETVASLTCSQIEELAQAKAVFPKMSFHYDGEISKEQLERVVKIVPKEQLIVWIPYQNRFTSWFKGGFVNAESAELIKQYAALGIWLLAEPQELEMAEAYGAEIVETNGHLKPAS